MLCRYLPPNTPSDAYAFYYGDVLTNDAMFEQVLTYSFTYQVGSRPAVDTKDLTYDPNAPPATPRPTKNPTVSPSGSPTLQPTSPTFYPSSNPTPPTIPRKEAQYSAGELAAYVGAGLGVGVVFILILQFCFFKKKKQVSDIALKETYSNKDTLIDGKHCLLMSSALTYLAGFFLADFLFSSDLPPSEERLN